MSKFVKVSKLKQMTMRLDAIEVLLRRLVTIESLLMQLTQKEKTIMITLDQVLSDVGAETTLVNSISTLLTSVKAQLDAALASAGGVTPAMQAQIDSVFAALETNNSALSDAITANTPVTPNP